MPYKDPAVQRTYSTWHSMKQRCHNPTHNSYIGYGSKGITVCEAWLKSFDNFVADMGYRPIGLSIDRVANYRGYDLENCRWATAKEQAANRSITYRIFCTCGRPLTYGSHYRRPRAICKVCNLASAKASYRQRMLVAGQ